MLYMGAGAVRSAMGIVGKKGVLVLMAGGGWWVEMVIGSESVFAVLSM